MTAAERRPAAPDRSPAVPEEARQAIVLRGFREDLAHWIRAEPRTALRVMRMIEEVIRDPFIGIGKPEALRAPMMSRVLIGNRRARRRSE